MNKIIALCFLTFFATTAQAQDPFWDAVEGPYSGSFWAGRVMSDGTYYAGGGDGRILRKLPGDEIWRLVATSPENQTILSFNEYDGWVFAADAHGYVLASRDNFDSWIIASTGINTSGTQIRSMLVAADGFFLGTSNGIYRYVYDAVRETPSWELTSFDTPRGKFVFSLADDASGTRYAGTGAGLYGTTDGVNWQPMGFNITATTIFSVATHNNDVYVGTANGVYVHYETSAPGEWTTLARYITKESFSVRNVSVINGRVYISVTGVGTYYSDDDANWIQLPYTDARGGFYADKDLLVVPSGNGVWTSSLADPNADVQKIGTPETITLLTSFGSRIFAAAARHTLYMTASPRDDKNWSSVFRVYNEGSVQCYAEKYDGNKYINLTASATGSPLFGFTMIPEQNGYDAIPFPSEVRMLNQFYVTQNDSVLVATNIGIYYFNTKTYEIKRLSKITVTGIEVFSISEDVDGNLYAATASGFYVSFDLGKTWTVSKLSGMQINQVCLVGSKEGYVGTGKGLYYFKDLSSDPELIDGFTLVNAFAQDGFGHLYVIDDKTIYYADSKNSEWVNVTGNLRGLLPRALRVVDNYVYIATDGGLFKHKCGEYAAITLSNLGYFTYDGAEKAAVATTSPNGLAVDITYNKTHVLPKAPGIYKVAAVVNDGTFFGEAFGKITIGGIPAVVKIIADDFVIYDGDPHGATAETNPPGLNVSITYNDIATVPSNAGEYEIKAVITGENYAGFAYDTITIDKAQQFISLEELPGDVLTTDGPFTLAATSSVGLPVQFTVAEGPARIEGNILSLTGGDGEVVITALQDGSINYYAANTVMHRMRVWEGTITGTEPEDESSLSIYPVPSNSGLINIESKRERLVAVSLMDITGRPIQSMKLTEPRTHVNLKTDQCPSGTYVLIIETGSHQKIYKRVQVLH